MDVFDLAAKITLDSSSYESGLAKASNALSGFGSKVSSGFGAIAKVGAAALAAASTAVVAFGASSVKTGAQFDSSMAQVAATMGTTVDSIQNLRDFAMQMGATTAFSANQSAEALNYMALAGYSAETSMQMLPTVLDLAAAGGMELATASDMVTDAQSALGLTLDETASMVDKMAKASSKSNTSVSQLGEAFLTVGGLAKNLSGGTTELSTVLGVLADNGIKGAEGGTHLRNMILKLSAPTANGTKILKNLGVSVFDATGKMRSFADIFPELNEAMATLTDEQRTQALSEIFNTTDIASVNALLATSKDRWEELAIAIDDSAGAAKAMANTQLDNLAGDITLFKSALEGAQIAISDKLTPSLREFVQFGTKGLSELTAAFLEGGLSGALDVLGEILAEGLTMITKMIPDVISAGGELLGALGEGILQNADTIIDAGISAVKQFIIGLGYGGADFVTGGAELIVKLLEGLTEALPQLVPIGIRAVERIGTALIEAAPEIATAVWEFASTLATELFNAIDEQLSASEFAGAWDALKTSTETTFSAIMEAIQTIADAIGPFEVDWTTVWDNVGIVISTAGEIISGVITTIGEGIALAIEWFQEIATEAETDGTFLNEVWTGVQEVFDSVWTFICTLIETVVEDISEYIDNLGEAFDWIAEQANTDGTLINTAWEDIQTVITTVIDVITEVINIYIALLQGDWDTAWNEAQGVVDTVMEAIHTTVDNDMQFVSDKVSGVLEDVSGWFDEHFGDALTTAQEKFEGIRKAVKEKIESARDTVEKAINKIKGFFNFTWKLPHLALPHLSVTGSFSLSPPSVPHFSIAWYKKAMENAMILNGATIFGAAGGKLLGGGEAGREVISGEDHLMSMIREASGGPFLEKIYRALTDEPRISIVVNGADYLDSRKLANAVAYEIQAQTMRKKAVHA